MAHGHHLFQVRLFQEIVQIPGHAGDGGGGRPGQGMAPVAPGVPAPDLVVGAQGGDEGKPFLVAGGPAVEHDDGGAAAAAFRVMDFFAVVGKEMGHGGDRGKRG